MPTAAEVMDDATTQTGLTDFGDDSFREGLEILLASLRDEARLHERGRAFLSHRVVGYLSQRLQVEDWYRRHPEIDDVPITSPLIGLGLPRTGSTALSMLLAQDPGVRYLRRWESSQPCPPPSTVQGVDPRIPPDKGEMVGTRYHVPADTHGPMECHELMALDFKSHLFQSFAEIPSYSEWLVDGADLTSTYRYERRVMKLLQWGEPERPWRLKCPSHVLWLDALDAVFPDARFVMTHRDPTDVILSAADLYADIIGSFSTEIDRAYIGQLNINIGRWAWSGQCNSVPAALRIGSTTLISALCRPIRSGRSPACMRGWGCRSGPSSKVGCGVGGRRPRLSASRAHMPIRCSSASTSTWCGPASLAMWIARPAGPLTKSQEARDN